MGWVNFIQNFMQSKEKECDHLLNLIKIHLSNSTIIEM
jgi:hypothetical protein